MEVTDVTLLRTQLLDRRQKLEEAATSLTAASEAARLLQEVDAALGRMDAGTFGICETCADPIEPERVLADPLTRFCLDHLTAVEQRAFQHDLDLASPLLRAGAGADLERLSKEAHLPAVRRLQPDDAI